MEIDIIKQRTHAIIDRVGTTRDKVIPLLQAIQQEFNYLPVDALNCVYESTDIDRAQLLSVATFYSQFRMAPYGQHVIKVCIGTACHVKGASHVYDAFVRELNLVEGAITTADGRYSIEKVACLGCCALAPVVQIDDKIFGHVQPGKVSKAPLPAPPRGSAGRRSTPRNGKLLPGKWYGRCLYGSYRGLSRIRH